MSNLKQLQNLLQETENPTFISEMYNKYRKNKGKNFNLIIEGFFLNHNIKNNNELQKELLKILKDEKFLYSSQRDYFLELLASNKNAFSKNILKTLIQFQSKDNDIINKINRNITDIEIENENINNEDSKIFKIIKNKAKR